MGEAWAGRTVPSGQVARGPACEEGLTLLGLLGYPLAHGMAWEGAWPEPHTPCPTTPGLFQRWGDMLCPGRVGEGLRSLLPSRSGTERLGLGVGRLHSGVRCPGMGWWGPGVGEQAECPGCPLPQRRPGPRGLD